MFSIRILLPSSRSATFQNFFRNASKRAPFVEKTRIASKEVKSPPKLPNFQAKRSNMAVTQTFDYLLVLDFEATCQENSLGPLQPIQEIIEFPVVQLCTKTWTEVRRFHEYVQPTVNPLITPFCTSLTGIIQEMVDNKPVLCQTLQHFDAWIKSDERLHDQNFAFVSCGDWDLKVALPKESHYKQIEIPDYFNRWINVKRSYAQHTGQFIRGMKQLLSVYSLQLIGRHHSGIDDVTNICEIVKCLGKDGHNYRITGSTDSNSPLNAPRTFKDTKNLV